VSNLTVLSLGWGVQSFTLAAMAALGDLPLLDYAVHADTGYEAAWTYAFAAKWTPWLEEHGVKVRTVRDETGQRRPIGQWGGVMIPAHYPETKKFGAGMLKRQCTDQWKRAPIRRFVHAQAKTATMWIGISYDESLREKASDVKWLTHEHPLLDRRMRRSDCVHWLLEHGLGVPHKSSCYFCPFHRHADWMFAKHASFNDWVRAVAVDEQIRQHKQTFELYLHQSRKPLAVATDESLGVQLDLIQDDCSGLCWT
jgi:hypothetical protein